MLQTCLPHKRLHKGRLHKAKRPLFGSGLFELECIWCPGENSNLHILRYTDLNRARLPIPPPGHSKQFNITLSVSQAGDKNFALSR